MLLMDNTRTHLYICSYNDSDDPFLVVSEPENLERNVEIAVYDLHEAEIIHGSMDGNNGTFYCRNEMDGEFKVFAVAQKDIYGIELINQIGEQNERL